MLTHPVNGIAPQALRAPDIPGRTEPPLPSGEWGINRAAALDNFPLKGLKVFILPWADMRKSDWVELYYDGASVDQHTITEDIEIDERVTLWVQPGRINSGPHTLGYTVHRANQVAEPYEPPVRIYIKLELPGGQDVNPRPGEHSELYQYIDPQIVADGVDSDSAKNGVQVIIQAKPGSPSKLPYPNCAAGDVITLSWGGVRVYSIPVTQPQVDDPDAHPIVVLVTEADILEAGDSGPDGLAVTFTVHDLVNNAAEDWCTETRIVVDTGNSRLDAPILDQANGHVLDLDLLNDEELLLKVWADPEGVYQENDVIIMYIKGTSESGEPVKRQSRQTISKRPPVVVEILLPNSAARALANTQALFFYELERGGAVIQHSRGRFISIIGEPYRLAAPIAVDAVGGALHPDLAPIRVRIPNDERIEEGMAIELKWLGTRADLSTYEPELPWHFPDADEATHPAGFIVSVDDNRHLKTLEGGTLDLSYNVLSDEDDEIVIRASLHAPLLTVGEAKLELVPPIVLGEQDGALEPKDLPNGTSKITCPNPIANPTKAKDVVIWQLRDAYNVLLDEGSKILNALNAGKPVDFTLDAAFVQQYFEARRGETLSVSYSILRFETGNTSHSNPLVFVVGNSHSGKLTVVGNRSQTSPRYHSNLSRLTASFLINGRINTPTEAVWMYAGDTEGALAQSFLDTEPEKPLIVSLLDGENIIARTVLRPGNVSGIFNLANRHSGCIIKDDGNVFGWSDNTEMLPPSELKDVRYVAAGGHAFAALKKDDTVVAWGATSLGGYIAPEIEKELTNVGKLAATDGAFVALRKDGQLVAWGNPEYGGSIPVSAISELGPAKKVIGNTADFTVLLIDGRVFSWGASWPEGFWVSGARGATQLCASDRAFCALNADRSVVAWGSPEHGGVMPGRTHNCAEEVVLVTSTSAAFAALRSDGTVIAWGNQRFGGETPSGLQSVSHLSGSTTAFCALKTDGSLFAWGVSEEGGQIPEGLAPALSIASSYGSFSAVLTTHRAVSWGVNTSSTKLQSVACAYAAGPHLVLLSADRQLQSAGPNAPDLKALSGLVSYTE